MAADPGSVAGRLERWRAQGADRVDPVAFSRLAALARRAQRHDGVVAQHLQQRVQQLADDYSRTLAAATAAVPPATVAAGVSPLRTLLAHIAQAGACTPAAASTPVTPPSATMSTDTAPLHPAPLPVVEAQATLDEFQQLWSRIRIDSLLRQSQEAISEDAGPLHSSVLLHRAMKLMREISPAYLQHFLAYSDALSWLEQLQAGGNAAGTEPGRSAARKTSRTAAPRRRKSPAAAADQITDGPAS